MTARETFEAARDAAVRIERLTWQLEGDTSHASGSPAHARGVSDPTAQAATFLLETAPAIEAEIGRLERVVDEARRLIDGVRLAFETPWWEALELRYVDGMAWPDVAEAMGIGRATAIRWHDAALEWIDFVGEARARQGRGAAE